MERLINFINTIKPLEPVTLQELIKICTVKEYKANEHLCEIGDNNNSLFFVLEGITRTYVKADNQTEINKTLSFPGNLATSLKSAIKHTPSKFGCQALTKTVVIEANFDDLAKLRNQYIDFCEFMYKCIEQEYMKVEENIIDTLSKNASQRYLELREKIKDIDNLIPQYHIASHLGITPIQLSRIRKKLNSL